MGHMGAVMAVGSTLLAERYELGRVLGGGRVGEVWEARDRMLGRRVAVKVAHARLAQDAAFNDGFLRAVQEAAAIEHPGAVAVHDAGSAGRTPFVVMEYVEGRTLREVVRDAGELPVPRAVRVAADIASVLVAAHARGLAHGGIHAGNAFLTPTGQVKLADLGLARLTAPSLTSPATPPPAREQGEVRAWDPRQGPVGELIAPAGADADDDQAPARPATAVNGSAPPIEPVVGEAARADLVALGGLLYELLSGRPAGQAERRPLRAARPDVPPELDGIVRNALAGRYRSAVELREALWRGSQQAAAEAGQGRPAIAPRQPRPAANVPATHAERVRALTAQPGPSVRPWVLLAALIVALVVAGWSAAGVLAFQQPLWSASAATTASPTTQPAHNPLPTSGPTTTVAATTTTVAVVASPANGSAGKAVPKVVGMQVEAAIAKLAAAGTPAGTVWRRRSADVAMDVVIQSIPPAGGHLLKGDKVVLVVSNGTKPDPVTTPVPGGGP